VCLCRVCKDFFGVVRVCQLLYLVHTSCLQVCACVRDRVCVYAFLFVFVCVRSGARVFISMCVIGLFCKRAL